MDRRKKTTGKIKGMFHTSGTKHGSYSVGLTVLVIAIVIVFNLVIGQIPEAYRNLDMSSTKIYEISDTTKDLLSGLNDKVDMKVLAVKKDTDDRIKTFISKYAALSDKINVEWIDPVLHPSALTEYNASENTTLYLVKQQERQQLFLLTRFLLWIRLPIIIQEMHLIQNLTEMAS